MMAIARALLIAVCHCEKTENKQDLKRQSMALECFPTLYGAFAVYLCTQIKGTTGKRSFFFNTFVDKQIHRHFIPS